MYRRDFLKLMGLSAAAMVLPPVLRLRREYTAPLRTVEDGQVPMRVPYGIAAEAARMKIYLPVVRR